MGWGQWMVPELTAAQDLRLRAQELEITNTASQNPEAVGHLCAQLLRQSVMYEVILRKATHRIAELEMREALQERQPPKRVGWLSLLMARR